MVIARLTGAEYPDVLSGLLGAQQIGPPPK
jgi:hypothetical protein